MREGAAERRSNDRESTENSHKIPKSAGQRHRFSTKIGVKWKNLLCFIFIFGIIGFGIREIQLWIEWFGENGTLPNRGTAKGNLPVRV